MVRRRTSFVPEIRIMAASRETGLDEDDVEYDYVMSSRSVTRSVQAYENSESSESSGENCLDSRYANRDQRPQCVFS